MQRRTLLAMTGAAFSGNIARAATPPIIDTHIHLFDTGRPGGVPWPEKKDTVLYKPSLPERYRRITAPFGIRGYIVVEASPLLEDNQWVLDTGGRDSRFLGMVGNLKAGQADFGKHFERFHRNPLFLGIRYGNIWDYDLGREVTKPAFLSDMKTLADAGLELDTADQDPALIHAVVRLTDRVPSLRVVIDHLPQMDPPRDEKARRAVQEDLRELARRPQVYVKVSEVPRRVNGKVPEDLGFYRSRLDEVWETFGADRLVYGSDWPNSDIWGPYGLALGLVTKYFSGKGQTASEKFFWRNSVAAYHWKARDPGQPHV